MNVLDVVRELNVQNDAWGSMWFRPVGWRGLKSAFVIEDNRVMFVPTSSGGHPAHFPSPDELLGEWEIVEPSVVLEGN